MTDAAGSYVPDQQWHKEHLRLAAMERMWDPGTRAVIEALGIAPGWRCLEVGAGAGSIAAWLADEVAPGGEVLASDLDTSRLRALRAPGLEVREHDILRNIQSGSDLTTQILGNRGKHERVHRVGQVVHAGTRHPGVERFAFDAPRNAGNRIGAPVRRSDGPSQ